MQIFALIALAHSRAANIYPCAKLINLLRPAELRIPESHKFMMWFSGLRGAIAFALSLEAVEDLPGDLVYGTWGFVVQNFTKTI